MFPKPSFKRRKPKRGERGRITQEQYQKAIDAFGEACVICGQLPIEMHHIRFRSQAGRGVWRNLTPLCGKHHKEAHTNSAFAILLRQEREERFGKYYYCDRFDLSDHGHIDGPCEKQFEEFMRNGEKK